MPLLPSELALIDRIRTRVSPGSGVVLGIGDDCAVVRPRGAAEDWLYTTDMLIEGTHFLRATHNAADIGWKTVARGLSDIAAMGGTPRFCLLSLALGDWVDTRWVDGFYRGLLRLAESSGAALIGGDVARQPHVTCDIVVAGTVARGKKPCAAMARGRATRSMFRARSAAPHSGSPPNAERRGQGTSVPNRGSRSDAFYENACARPPPWT